MVRYFIFLLIIIVFSSCVNTKYGFDSQYVVNIKDYGAIPNDENDDSEAIQKAIDFAIQSNKSSRVFCPPGLYILDKGLVIARSLANGEFGFVTLTIGGGVATYAGDQNIGKTTLFRLKNPTFGIALQSARNCVIENIVFEGCAKYTTDPVKIIEWKENDWGVKSNASSNRNSPSCAIVIDPFHKNVPTSDRYKGHESKYKNTSNGGSSMVVVKGCSFFNHYIAIANNPSSGVQNGDNIRAENCHVSTCHTFWSAGQTQSRGNSIENVYALFLHTFISGTQIGSQQGTPPTVSNVNLAGFCKQVFDIQTGFSGLNIFRSYFESVWSLGLSRGLSTSFDQCQFSFVTPNQDIFMPPFQLYSTNSTSFRDCNIQYFDNCNTPMPFIFRSRELFISGGSVEGGVVVADGVTNAGGDDLHKVTLQGVFIKCLDKVAGKKPTMKPESKVKNEIIMGGEIIITNEGELAVNQATTYDINYMEKAYLEIKGHSMVFVSSGSNTYKKGDNLFAGIDLSASMSGLGDVKIRPFLGYVSEISGQTVTIKGIPVGIHSGEHTIFRVAFPVYDANNQSSRGSSSKIVRYQRNN